MVCLYGVVDGPGNFYSSSGFSRAGRSFSDLLWIIMPGLKVMGSVPWFCGGSAWVHKLHNGAAAAENTHPHVLLGRLLPLLGHGARSHGVGEQAGDTKDGAGSGDEASGQEKDLAALIRRRGSSGTVGTEGDVVCYVMKVSPGGPR